MSSSDSDSAGQRPKRPRRRETLVRLGRRGRLPFSRDIAAALHCEGTEERHHPESIPIGESSRHRQSGVDLKLSHDEEIPAHAPSSDRISEANSKHKLPWGHAMVLDASKSCSLSALGSSQDPETVTIPIQPSPSALFWEESMEFSSGPVETEPAGPVLAEPAEHPNLAASSKTASRDDRLDLVTDDSYESDLSSAINTVPAANSPQADTMAVEIAYMLENESEVNPQDSPECLMLQFGKLCKWQSVMAASLVTGTVHFSVEHYEIFRVSINRCLRALDPQEAGLPCYSAVSRTFLPLLRQWSFPRIEMVEAPLDTSKSGARVRYLRRGSDAGSERKTLVCIVQPSEWAKLDVGFKHTWDILKSSISDSTARNPLDPLFYDVTTTPIVRSPEIILDPLSRVTACEQLTDREDAGYSLLTARSSGTPELRINLYEDLPFSTAVLQEMRSLFDLDDSGEGTVSLTAKATKTVLVGAASNVEVLGGSVSVRRSALDDAAFFRRQILGSTRACLWRAGDTCTVLSGKENCSSIYLLLHKHNRFAGPDYRVALVQLPIETGLHDGPDEVVDVLISEGKVAMVRSVEVLNRMDRGLSPIQSSHVPHYGRLKNGKLYFIYSVMLYSDGFSQYKFKKGSAGGIYMLPLNLPPDRRTSRDAVHCIGLTPPGVSTKFVLHKIIPDIVNCAVAGTLAHNAEGEEMLTFLNPVGFVSDSVEEAHDLDILGPCGDAPCHLCSFPKYKGHPRSGSKNASNTVINSFDLSHARTGPRTDALRDADIPSAAFQKLGLNDSIKAQEKDSPLVALYSALKVAVEEADIPLTENDLPVVNPQFDPYRSPFVAPDHLLSGMAINILTAAFLSLPDKRTRKLADKLICHGLESNGLIEQHQIFNESAHSLFSTSISGTFCTLLVASAVFDEAYAEFASVPNRSRGRQPTPAQLRAVVKVLIELNNLCAQTYWYPKLQVDGESAVRKFNHAGGVSHILSLEDKAHKLLTSWNRLCTQYSSIAGELDKPNAHRLLELYKHAIPALGHVHHFSELIYECAHQPLKRAMERSNHLDAHLQAVSHAIANDWKQRLSAVLHGDREEPVHLQTLNLFSLLCGRDARSQSILLSALNSHMLEDVLSNELLRGVLRNSQLQAGNEGLDSRWEVLAKVELSEWQEPLSALYVGNADNQMACSSELRFYTHASRVRYRGKGNNAYKLHTRRHDFVRRGDLMQAQVKESHDSFRISSSVATGTPPHTIDSVLNIFCVEGIAVDGSSSGLSSRNGEGKVVIAFVKRCDVLQGHQCKVSPNTSTQILELNSTVRRVAAVHCCGEGHSMSECVDSTSAARVKHNASVLSGASFTSLRGSVGILRVLRSVR